MTKQKEKEWFAREKSWGEGQLKGWVILPVKKGNFLHIFIFPIDANFDQIPKNTVLKNCPSIASTKGNVFTGPETRKHLRPLLQRPRETFTVLPPSPAPQAQTLNTKPPPC